MSQPSATIRDVSDTALWVATYRARETARPDALFKDPLAVRLTEGRAQAIAATMRGLSTHTQHNVVMRTVIIDGFVRELAQAGVDTVINLGAGLDTRPYRLDLPATLRWIEIDFPHLIEFKTAKLAGEVPRVRLDRIPLDLADRAKRRAIFRELAASSQRTLILTEGVLPYLTPEQVAELAEDLHAHPVFRHWIIDYVSPLVYKYLRSPQRTAQMQNAPFRFFPEDRAGFFKDLGWDTGAIRYINEEALRLGRRLPAPWWTFILRPFLPAKMREAFLKASAYLVLERRESPSGPA